MGVGSGDRELGNGAVGVDAPNLVRILLSKPHLAVRAERDVERVAGSMGGSPELLDGTDFGPGGAPAQAQQAGTGKTECYKCDQTRL